MNSVYTTKEYCDSKNCCTYKKIYIYDQILIWEQSLSLKIEVRCPIPISELADFVFNTDIW